MKTAFITGVTGQDGSLLSKLLLEKDYVVYGMIRRTSSPTDWRLIELELYKNPKFHVVSGDLTDFGSMHSAIIKAEPDEVYNLGAQSFVGGSWAYPQATWDIAGAGALRVFEAVRLAQESLGKCIKIYQASSSEMFGGACKIHPMDENEPFHPRSPYGVAKCAAHLQARVNRESYGQFISCGILFNHEGPYRGVEFVTRKITDAVAKIYNGKIGQLELGCVDSHRDWGSAEDYVRAMWLMLQQDNPDDFVVATGESYSIADFCNLAFAEMKMNWRNYVVINGSMARPADVKALLGNPAKAQKVLGWKPIISFEQMISDMVSADVRRQEQSVNLNKEIKQ